MVNTPECLIAEEARAPPSAFYTPGPLLFPETRGGRRGVGGGDSLINIPCTRGAETQKPWQRDGGEQLRP